MGCNCKSYNRPDLGGADEEVILNQVAFFPDTERQTVCVDACISAVIEALWAVGVRTEGSCCGHNGAFGIASVILTSPSDAGKCAAVLATDTRPWQVIFYAGASGSKLTATHTPRAPAADGGE